jgi:hypothetical protein
MKVSLRLRLKGYAADGTARGTVAAEMGRSTDAEGDGDVRRRLPQISCTGGLTKPSP